MVSGLPPYERNIGMVFQNYALWPHMTVAGNVAYGLRLRKLPAAEIARPARRGAAEGQPRRARVALSRASSRAASSSAWPWRGRSCSNPDILLLDEPLSNLDAKIRVQVRAEIRKLQQELGITTIYVTHDQEEALSLSDRVAVMKDGRVLQVGAPKELYERPAHALRGRLRRHQQPRGRARCASARRPELDRGHGARARCAPSPNGPVGERCVLAIRPENVAVGPAAAARRGQRRRAAGCASSSYLGNTLRYDVETAGGHVLKADIRDPWHHEPLPDRPGGRVELPRVASPCAVADDD